MSELSPAERRLMEFCGFSDFVDVAERGSLAVPCLWAVIGSRLFVTDARGSHVDAVRRVLLALEKSSPYRFTPEFDALCQFEPSTPENLLNNLAAIRQQIENAGYHVQATWMDEYGGEQSALLGNTDRLTVT